MSLKDYNVPSDKFELDTRKTVKEFACAFCLLCLHRYKTTKEEPCRSCGHNVNAEIKDDEKKNKHRCTNCLNNMNELCEECDGDNSQFKAKEDANDKS